MNDRHAIVTVADAADLLRDASAAVQHRRRRARPLVLDMWLLAAILGIDEISGIVHFEVGVTAGQLDTALARAGLVLRHEPPLLAEATIGDSLSALSDAVCGLEALLPDGRMVRLRPGPRRAVGPDLVALATMGSPRLLVPVAAYLRASRRGDDPWIGWFAADSPELALAGVQAFLRRGVRPIATEIRVITKEATLVRVEVNLPAPVRVASAAIVVDEMARAGAPGTDARSWAADSFVDVESRWLPFADLARASRRPPVRIVRIDPWGAEVQFAKTPPATPVVKGPSRSFEELLARLKAELDPKSVLP